MPYRMVNKKNMNLKLVFIGTFVLLSFAAQAQFIGNYVEKRISSGPDANYIFLMDDEFLIKNNGQMPDPYRDHSAIIVERSEDNANFEVIGSVSPVQSLAEFDAIWGDTASKLVLEDTSFFDLNDEAELVQYFRNPNNQFYQLFLFPLKLFKAIGFVYEDKTAEKGVKYFYRLKYADTDKIILSGDVLTGEDNKVLMRYKFNFNQASIKSVDSLLVGTWAYLNNDLRMVSKVEVFGKKTFDTSYELINTLKPTYDGDTLLASVFHKVNKGEAWQVYVQPIDLIGNRGPVSDTATLISLSTGKLPFVKNFQTKDTTNAVYLSWDELPAHSYLSAYLLSKTDSQNRFRILDTLALNTTEYYDFEVETGTTYNYEIIPLAAPVSNFRTRDFTPVRASGTHVEIQRVLPPQEFTVSQEGENFRISWSPVEDDRISYYSVMSNLDANNLSFNTIANIVSDTTYLDTLNYGDLNHLTRYYTLKSVSYGQKFSDIAPPVSITPKFPKKVLAPNGLALRPFKDAIKVTWEQDFASQNWIKGYKVFRSADNEDWELLNPDSLSTEREFLDEGLETGNYTYKISGISLTGDESPFSPTQNITFKGVKYLESSAFSKVNYRNIPPGVEISWQCVINKMPTRVAVYRKPIIGDDPYTLLALVPVEEMRFWDKETKSGETYFYAVEAVFEGQPKAENLEFVRPFMRAAVKDTED